MDQYEIRIGTPIELIAKEKNANCAFCYRWSTSNVTIMGQHVCYNCRNKFLERVKLILKFE